ncbi:hypothetical protein KF083_004925 [Salmonella enterica]|nr:hypothetical protein [Salmonella enterica]EBR4999553.1 hypothetical protein [Salmonella enterica]EDI8177509.1 hypothetical protein [Salmonella enterica]EEK5588900.1 hypothetical protein [Salmonella enterica]EFU5244823.1 hypothetical protein [Salmonella enterica]
MADTVSGDSRGGWTNEYDPEAVFYYGGGKRPDIVNSVFVITLAVRATRICTNRMNLKNTLGNIETDSKFKHGGFSYVIRIVTVVRL